MPERQQLLKGDEVVRVGCRALDLLTALVERRGQVVSKAELVAIAWPRLVVEEGNLKVNIFAIRRILGDAANPPRYIETVAGVGYRFIADVQCDVHRLHTYRLPPHQAAQAASPGDLPALRGPVYGREEMVRSVLQDLRQTRLVSIVGPGGIGKTTVALAVAHSSVDAYSAGVRFIDLARLDDPGLVPPLMADAMREAAGSAALGLPRFRQGQDHELLLVLDNCEHLIGAVATCADQLLASTRGVTLIATSREPLSIRGEVVRRLPGLAMPPGAGGTVSTSDALRSPAVQLFAARASENAQPFSLDDGNATEVVAICGRLDGHALAIERVARRVGALGIAGTLEHMERRFHMFDGHYEGPARHRTLTANIAASYMLLSPDEQALLRRLSVFDTPFSLASACVMGGGRDLDPSLVVEDIGQLVAKSLLLAEIHGGEMRYRQSPVTRAFLCEKLIECDELEEARHRLAALLAEAQAAGALAVDQGTR